MKIIVTGVAGFIGSHLAEKLLILNHEIIGIDNLNNYYSIKHKHKNLDILYKYDNFIFIKEDITNIPDPLESLKKLNGVLFNWKDEWIKNQGGEDGYFVRKKDVGVIAQEVEKVLPEAVAQREDGIKAVKYDRLTCLLIEAVKKLSEKVETLSKEKN